MFLTPQKLLLLLITLCFVWLLNKFCFELRYIPSGAMKPTLIENDRLLVNKMVKNHKRGDIIIHYVPQIKDKRIAYCKRIIGLPNDRIEIKADDTGKSTVYINNEPLDEPYIMSQFDYPPCNEESCGPISIPEGSYFVMGDNRGNSQDSRHYGTIQKKDIIGKVVYRYYPFSRHKKL